MVEFPASVVHKLPAEFIADSILINKKKTDWIGFIKIIQVAFLSNDTLGI